jgi:hypothetical protein
VSGRPALRGRRAGSIRGRTRERTPPPLLAWWRDRSAASLRAAPRGAARSAAGARGRANRTCGGNPQSRPRSGSPDGELDAQGLAADPEHEAQAIMNASRHRLGLGDRIDEVQHRCRIEALAREQVEILALPVVQVESCQGGTAAEIEDVGQLARGQTVEHVALGCAQLTERHALPRALATPPRRARSGLESPAGSEARRDVRTALRPSRDRGRNRGTSPRSAGAARADRRMRTMSATSDDDTPRVT